MGILVLGIESYTSINYHQKLNAVQANNSCGHNTSDTQEWSKKPHKLLAGPDNILVKSNGRKYFIATFLLDRHFEFLLGQFEVLSDGNSKYNEKYLEPNGAMNKSKSLKYVQYFVNEIESFRF